MQGLQSSHKSKENSPNDFLKQSVLSSVQNQEMLKSSGPAQNFENMSQLGQFAQLSYLLSQKGGTSEIQNKNSAFENFKNDKSLINNLQSQL